jgi:crotonobetainyl-CoA:carnitine CoA-transferase CaiB-like acyl-CoA transferase
MNAEALITILDAEFVTRPRGEWTSRFDLHDVWWAPVQTVAEVIEDPQAIAAGSFVTVDGLVDHAGQSRRVVASPVEFSDFDQQPGAVPALGEHTAEIRAELDSDVGKR